MASSKTFRIGDILTNAEIRRAACMGDDAARISREIIEPKIAEINRRLGQENDPMYLAYAVVYALGRAAGGN